MSQDREKRKALTSLLGSLDSLRRVTISFLFIENALVVIGSHKLNNCPPTSPSNLCLLGTVVDGKFCLLTLRHYFCRIKLNNSRQA